MVLEVEPLRVAFRTEKGLSVPVRDVSFAIPENGRVALVGESGCGKSVTSLALGGLVDRAEISGAVKGSPRIAYVFQNPMQSLNPVMRVGVQVAEGIRERGTGKRERVGELLKAVGLPEGTERKYPCEMRGGQQQRAMIAMALAQDPELLIADEPTTALDVTTQQDVLDLVARIADERKMAVLLITHNLGLVARYSKFARQNACDSRFAAASLHAGAHRGRSASRRAEGRTPRRHSGNGSASDKLAYRLCFSSALQIRKTRMFSA